MRNKPARIVIPAVVLLGLGAAVAIASNASAAIAVPQTIRFDGGGFDRGGAVTSDAAGNIYLGGSIANGVNATGGFGVLKLDPQGNLRFRAGFSGSRGFFGTVAAVATDPAGNLYAAGVTFNSGEVGADADALLVKYSPTGQELWSRRLEAAQNFRRVAVSADGGAVFVSGQMFGDLATQRYNADGTLQWTRFQGSPAAAEVFGDMRLAPNGNVVVSHATNNNGDTITFDFDTIVFDPQGNEVWRRLFTVDGPSHEIVSALAIDSANRIVVTGTTAANANPEVGGPTTRGITVRYDAAGNLVQTLASGSDAVDVDAADNVYLVGFVANAAPPTVTRLSPTGAVVYQRTIDSDPAGPFQIVAARVDATGVVSVVANQFTATTGTDYLTIQYAASGTELGRHRFNGTANFTDEVAGLAIGAQGTVLVTGTSRSRTGANQSDDIVTLRFGGGAAPGPSAPDAASNLTAQALSRSQIQLAWRDNANNEDGFRVQRCTGNGCANFTTIATVGAGITSLRDSGLARNTTFRYRIVAINAAGEAAPSNVAAATTRRR